MAYLNLLLRRKADEAATPDERASLLKQADDLVEKAKEIKQKKMEAPAKLLAIGLASFLSFVKKAAQTRAAFLFCASDGLLSVSCCASIPGSAPLELFSRSAHQIDLK